MNRPKDPSQKVQRERSQPSFQVRKARHPDDFERTIPGKRTPHFDKQYDRVVNTDEQQKIVNEKDDNVQTSQDPPVNNVEKKNWLSENENERLEAGNDNNEVNARPKDVN